MIQKDEDLTLAQRVGRNLKVLIKPSGCKSQVEFAKKMDVADVTVRRWIHDGISDIDRIKEIADVLKVDIFKLLAPLSE